MYEKEDLKKYSVQNPVANKWKNRQAENLPHCYFFY